MPKSVIWTRGILLAGAVALFCAAAFASGRESNLALPLRSAAIAAFSAGVSMRWVRAGVNWLGPLFVGLGALALLRASYTLGYSVATSAPASSAAAWGGAALAAFLGAILAFRVRA